MRSKISTAAEVVGLVGIPVSIGSLLGRAVGVLVASVMLVGVGFLLGDTEAGDV